MSVRPSAELNAKSETCVGFGTMLKTSAVIGAGKPTYTSTCPSFDSGGHDGNWASVHLIDVASGLDMRPGGRSTRTFLTLPSAMPPVLFSVKSVTPTSG